MFLIASVETQKNRSISEKAGNNNSTFTGMIKMRISFKAMPDFPVFIF